MKFVFDQNGINALKAANVICPNKDIRYYLNAICIDTMDSKPVIVATDGHRMTRSYITWGEGIGSADRDHGQWLIPKPACEWIAKLKTGKTPEAELSIEFGDTAVTVAYLLQSASFPLIDGKFPDWRRVVPTGGTIPTPEIGFNAVYLADIYKWANTLCSDKFVSVRCELRNTNVAMVCYLNKGTDHSYLVMPTRI
jgi:DNA polymerase-3 subunit beta